jgi:aryl-alcohol dehydrogenase-like predicted oxidoreductase
VNYFDTAAAGAYGLSQTRYGLALKDVRDKIVFATKTRHRTATQAQLDLDQSLSNLKTDYLDLYQVHNVINDEDIEFIFGPKGVMEMIEKAKKAGKIRFVGVTGHTDPKILNKILARYDFATILMPLSVTDGGNHQKSFEKETLPLAKQKGMGVMPELRVVASRFNGNRGLPRRAGGGGERPGGASRQAADRRGDGAPASARRRFRTGATGALEAASGARRDAGVSCRLGQPVASSSRLSYYKVRLCRAPRH